jgi:hypothetical protein
MDDKKVQQGIERQQLQKEVKKRIQTKRQRIQESASNYGTLTNALLNGSLVKWMFVLFMLVGTIALFNENIDNHWFSISNIDGQEKYTFNDEAYEVDYMTYSNIGEQMISNFEGVTTYIDIGNEVFQVAANVINSFVNFFDDFKLFRDKPYEAFPVPRAEYYEGLD